MSDASPPPFSFAQFVPGFDFLRNLAAGGAATAGTMPGMGGMSSWVAPTLSVEEIDKRIQELKAVQYWLEQNGHALKATIQALEVQRMTLSTLRGMNVRMEDLAQAFADSTTRAAEAVRDAAQAATAAAPAPREEAGASEPAPEPAAQTPDAQAEAPAAAPGVIDPLQWWGSLTQQFQQIASHAIKEASAMQMPMAPGTMPEAAAAAKPAGRKAPAKKASARKTAARKKPVAPRSTAGKKPAAAASSATGARRSGGNRSTG
ncbi:PhaM family polyhydroxyalkanoate granule multifunctional regulatory protein [Pseudacidovorax sp. RU35E]|uniref:PhaM family polyhydroxyalkanoate granule multifunctional regulatory protein n=1 Tax=Pseudacidovorax sp. RU35E TaxID=1907403 RepID=UPI0009545608|nr:PhaM family polyhydroxyalkanoate granule multifunctional regulatory protein [Pseudacidovorax sp. RU35E]SIQ77304.1 hypothetical protein SAMN05880557_105351 [Pseudacidovorax sp. RU35E]